MDTGSLDARLALMRCPICKSEHLERGGADRLTKLVCINCSRSFPIVGERFISLMPREILSNTKKGIQNFWGDTCRQWYSPIDARMDRQLLYKLLEDLEVLFRRRRHMAVVEVDLETLRGKQLLEIGSGGGAHSSLFKKYGANVTSLDITPERASSTGKKLAMIDEGTGIAVQADAENLPFVDQAFDIVYSNGVLHHSENTQKCIDEVFRTLKPRGRAMIMLYSRHSALYWLNLLPKTILNGTIFTLPEGKRLGFITEGKPLYGRYKNPVTRVYSKSQIQKSFQNFLLQSLRKSSFLFSQIPFAGRLREPLFKKLGHSASQGGLLVYGSPFIGENRIELLLGRFAGFAWNIVAQKP